MAAKKLSQLPNLPTSPALDGSEVVIVNKGSTTYKTTVATLIANQLAGLGSGGSGTVDPTAAIAQVNAARDTAITQVNTAGTTNVGQITTARTAAVAAVNTAGTDAQTAIDEQNAIAQAQIAEAILQLQTIIVNFNAQQ